jgi:hypothetical protein
MSLIKLLNADAPLSGFTTWRGVFIIPRSRLSSVREDISSSVAMPNLTLTTEPINTFGQLAKIEVAEPEVQVAA